MKNEFKQDRHVRVSMLVCNTFENDARVLKEAETLVQAGYQVTVHALALPGVPPSLEVLSSGIRVQRHGTSSTKAEGRANSNRQERSKLEVLALMASRAGALLSMIWSMFRDCPDIVHAHDVNMLPTSWFAARLTKALLIYDAHEISTDREGYKSFRGLVALIEKKLMPQAAGTITTTDARAKFFARAYRIERPLVLQNRPRLIKVVASNRIREELALENNWPIVLYQGGLQPGRGLPRLVEAAALVPGAYFIFIGGGRQTQELKDLVEKLELNEQVHFISTVPLAELPYYTASADIGVQPIENTCLNHFTTDSNKLFEYVVAGLPVVATQLPEISKVVRKYDLGLLVPPADTRALADAILQLVQDEQARKLYSHHAEQASQTLNWETQEQALIELYAKVLPTRGRAELHD